MQNHHFTVLADFPDIVTTFSVSFPDASSTVQGKDFAGVLRFRDGSANAIDTVESNLHYSLALSGLYRYLDRDGRTSDSQVALGPVTIRPGFQQLSLDLVAWRARVKTVAEARALLGMPWISASNGGAIPRWTKPMREDTSWN